MAETGGSHSSRCLPDPDDPEQLKTYYERHYRDCLLLIHPAWCTRQEKSILSESVARTSPSIKNEVIAITNSKRK